MHGLPRAMCFRPVKVLLLPSADIPKVFFLSTNKSTYFTPSAFLCKDHTFWDKTDLHSFSAFPTIFLSIEITSVIDFWLSHKWYINSNSPKTVPGALKFHRDVSEIVLQKRRGGVARVWMQRPATDWPWKEDPLLCV